MPPEPPSIESLLADMVRREVERQLAARSLATTPSPAPVQPKEWLSEAEVAELIGVSRDTLQTWRRDGSGPPYRKAGPRMIRYARRDVEAWLAARPN